MLKKTLSDANLLVPNQLIWPLQLGVLIITLRASEAAVQCIVIAPVCLCVYLWVCYHDNSKLRASILTKLGLQVKESDHLQLIKFWPSCAPVKRVCGRAKLLVPPYYSQRAVFASPPSAFFVIMM